MINLKLAYSAIDKNGILLFDEPLRDSHSFVRNAWIWMFMVIGGYAPDDAVSFGDTFLSFKDTGGTVRNGPDCFGGTTDITNTAEAFMAASNVQTYGPVIGIGVGAESFDDYILGTQIDTGNGAGQMAYVATSSSTQSYAGTTMTNTIIRYFNNNKIPYEKQDHFLVGEINDAFCYFDLLFC